MCYARSTRPLSRPTTAGARAKNATAWPISHEKRSLPKYSLTNAPKVPLGNTCAPSQCKQGATLRYNPRPRRRSKRLHQGGWTGCPDSQVSRAHGPKALPWNRQNWHHRAFFHHGSGAGQPPLWTSARRCAATMRQTAPPMPRVPGDPVGRHNAAMLAWRTPGRPPTAGNAPEHMRTAHGSGHARAGNPQPA